MRPVTLLGAALLASCGFSPSHAVGLDAPGTTTPDAPDQTTCMQGATECVGRIVRTCGQDSMWDVAQDQTCDFTCASGACVVASNADSITVRSCGPAAPALDPGAGGTITYQHGGAGPELACSPACGGMMTIEPVANQDNVAWFCVSSINVQAGASLVVSTTNVPTSALGLIVDGTATIVGSISLDGGNATSGTNGGTAGPGGSSGGGKTDSSGSTGNGSGGGGGGQHADNDNQWVGGGGGGGGDYQAGAGGGSGQCQGGNPTVDGGRAGVMAFSPALIPLVGGSGGGGGGDATGGGGFGWAGGGGGGALQIAARLSIAITGVISARGGNGYGNTTIDGGGGGGAGGGVLLESPSLMITGSVLVDGGDGGQSGAGAGGAGATGTHAPQPGLSYNNTNQGGSGGGGGGGLAQLRTLNATCAAGISPVASCATAPLLSQ